MLFVEPVLEKFIAEPVGRNSILQESTKMPASGLKDALVHFPGHVAEMPGADMILRGLSWDSWGTKARAGM